MKTAFHTKNNIASSAATAMTSRSRTAPPAPVAIIAALLLLIAGPASAALIIDFGHVAQSGMEAPGYTTRDDARAAFDSRLTGGPLVEDFEGFLAPHNYGHHNFTSEQISMGTLELLPDATGNTFLQVHPYTGTAPYFKSIVKDRVLNGGRTNGSLGIDMRLTLDAPASAFGFDTGDYEVFGGILSLDLYSQGTLVESVVIPNPGVKDGATMNNGVAFFGVTFDDGTTFDRIDFIQQDNRNEAWTWDNFVVGSTVHPNEPPLVTIHAPSSGHLAAVGTALTLEGGIVDDDPAGTHTAEWIVSSPTMPETSIPGTVSGYAVSDPIEFTEAGVYSIKLVVTDPHGATGAATTVLNQLPAYVVVYDPEGGFVTGGGWVNSPPGSFFPALAHSVDDWDSTGAQGANGWTYGYREVHVGGTIDYNPACDFVPFPDDWWTGSIWDEPNADGDHLPWTFIGPVAGHPNWSPHQWPIRRWVSDVSGDVDITHWIAKAHIECGNGATGAVHHNGIRIADLVVEATDDVGDSQVVPATVEVGDTIDFILSPVGTDGIVDDSCDTSYFGGRVAIAGSADFAELGGWASFGFVSKYKNGAHIPTGQTEFQYHAWHLGENVPGVDLNFQSSSYDWLVVAGAKAKFKGVGTINGEGEYGFMVTATDGKVQGGGGVDRFRIKIWDLGTGVIVYDNQRGSDDDAELNDSTILGAGNIVVHKK